MTRPTSFKAGASGALLSDAPLVHAGRALAERGQVGLIWIDQDLTVTGRYGPLVAFVEVGNDVLHDIPALVGLEKDIAALRTNTQTVLELPAVAMISNASEDPPRLNLLLMWIEDQETHLCLAMPTGIASDIELDLAREIRRRLIAETELKAKSQQLARANQDLEEYASVIAHDLKTPMRALRYQVDDLDQALAQADQPDVSDQLKKLRNQVQRMSGMLTALFEYSAAGRKTDVIRDVDTRRLIEAIVGSLQTKNTDTIKITGDWPTFATLEQPLDLVLRNLIDNAVKHHDGACDLVVSIHGVDRDTRFEFSVIDNGPGIAQKHGSSIFLPFRTIEPVKDDEVRGLGLALVHRSVSVVGGNVRVDARKDGNRGAVFHVVWPKQAAPPR